MNAKNITIHSSGSPDPITKAVVPPVHFSTIFAMRKPSSDDGFQYGRIGNPTRSVLEESLAALHSAKHVCVFSSGSAAITAILATLKAGDHIVCHHTTYEGTVRLMTKLFSRFNVSVTFIDFTKPELIHRAIHKNTKFVWAESPTNPLLELLDIRMISHIAHKHGVSLVLDNTLATPIFQKPILQGADVVVESLTKGINGHSDAMGGLVATNNEQIFNDVRFLQHTMGAVLSPFDCFLILRGLKPLSIRTREQRNNAEIISAWMRKQKSVTSIFFPEIGTLISFAVNPKIVKPTRFLSKLNLITIAHSFGGPETLIQQPTSMMDQCFSNNRLKKMGITDNFFRLSVGVEDPSDIIADLNHALAPI